MRDELDSFFFDEARLVQYAEGAARQHLRGNACETSVALPQLKQSAALKHARRMLEEIKCAAACMT